MSMIFMSMKNRVMLSKYEFKAVEIGAEMHATLLIVHFVKKDAQKIESMIMKVTESFQNSIKFNSATSMNNYVLEKFG